MSKSVYYCTLFHELAKGPTKRQENDCLCCGSGTKSSRLYHGAGVKPCPQYFSSILYCIILTKEMQRCKIVYGRDVYV